MKLIKVLLLDKGERKGIHGFGLNQPFYTADMIIEKKSELTYCVIKNREGHTGYIRTDREMIK
jgi:hypothetical protein